MQLNRIAILLFLKGNEGVVFFSDRISYLQYTHRLSNSQISSKVRNCIAVLNKNKITYAFLRKELNHKKLKKLSLTKKGTYITVIQELAAIKTDTLQMTENSGLDKITDALSTVVENVPAPIKRNFLKVIGQLSTAALDIPIAWLEGKATEIRATSQARIQIIKSEGEKFAEQIEIPQAYIDKASEKYASKIIKEQINLDDIANRTAKELAENTNYNEEVTDKEISEDWLNEFENHARQMSTEEMKFIFSKILTNEVKNPGNFSIRTIRLVSQLDNIAAQLFQNLCSCAISMQVGNHVIDTRVVSFSGNAASNSLTKYGLSFDSLNILHEYGLIISDYNSYMNYLPCVVSEENKVAIGFKLGTGYYAFLPLDREKYDKNITLHGVGFTKSGKELYNIIPKKDNETYITDLKANFETKFLKLVDIKTN